MLPTEEPFDVITMLCSDTIFDLLLQFVRSFPGILVCFEDFQLVVKVANAVLPQTKRAVCVHKSENDGELCSANLHGSND